MGQIAATARRVAHLETLEGGGGAGHDAVTLDADAAALLDLNVQEIGLDTQAANVVFAGPTTGAANEPTFRALVAADLPASGRDFTIVFSWDGTLSVRTGELRISPHVACDILEVWARVNTAPAGASIIVDIHKNGVTVFTTQGNRPTIAAAGNYNLSVAPDVTGLVKTDYVTMDVDQVGSTTAGQSLSVGVRCRG
jgi:hypothetical protein